MSTLGFELFLRLYCIRYCIMLQQARETEVEDEDPIPSITVKVSNLYILSRCRGGSWILRGGVAELQKWGQFGPCGPHMVPKFMDIHCAKMVHEIV